MWKPTQLRNKKQSLTHIQLRRSSFLKKGKRFRIYFPLWQNLNKEFSYFSPSETRFLIKTFMKHWTSFRQSLTNWLLATLSFFWFLVSFSVAATPNKHQHVLHKVRMFMFIVSTINFRNFITLKSSFYHRTLDNYIHKYFEISFSS